MSDRTRPVTRYARTLEERIAVAKALGASVMSVPVAEVDRLRADNEALADALADIAGGECWNTACPPDERCDVCTARAALVRLEAHGD